MSGRPTREAQLAAKAVSSGRMTRDQAARHYGVSGETIRRHLREMGVGDLRRNTRPPRTD